MGIIISVVILILSMLIQAFLQLTPGTFALFYHYALGKNSTAKTNNLSLYFILGTIVFMTITWLIIYTLILAIFCQKSDFGSDFCPWLMAGIFFAESIAGFFFYYRKGKFTALFVSRQSAKNLSIHAQKVKTRSDAFILGLFAGTPELIFTLPLYIISATELMKITTIPRALIIAIYITVSIFPLFVIRTLYRCGYNLATIERLRVRAKLFVRLAICISFLLLTIATIGLGVLNHG